MSDHSELKRLAEAATPGEWACSERHDGRFWHISSGNQAIGATHAAGKKSTMAGTFEANAKFIAKANPKTVLTLIAEVEGLSAQHGRDSAELRSLCQARDDARKERDQLKAEVEQLRKDAERFRFIEQDASSGMSKIYGDDWLEVLDQLIGVGDKS